MELKDLRTEIDKIDEELVQLFKKRMEVCGQIAEAKKAQGLPVLDSAREEEKLRAVMAAAPEIKNQIAALYITIFDVSRRYQEQRLERL